MVCGDKDGVSGEGAADCRRGLLRSPGIAALLRSGSAGTMQNRRRWKDGHRAQRVSMAIHYSIRGWARGQGAQASAGGTPVLLGKPAQEQPWSA
jgi:hypothetical protein